MPSFAKRNSNWVIALVLLLSAGMTYYHLGIYRPRTVQRRAAEGLADGYSFGDDFYPIWLTSREAWLRHRDPYDPEMTTEIQRGLFGRPLDAAKPTDPPTNYRAFAYPVFVDLLFWPLSFLSFPAVRILFTVVLAAMTVASVPLWLTALGLRFNSRQLTIAILLTLSSYAVLEGVYASQLALLVGFLMAASFAALVKDRLFFAGTLLAFTFIKPQMSLLVALYLLVWSFSDWHKHRAFVWGLMAWSAFLAGASLLVWPHWISGWLHVLSGYGNYSQPPLIIYSLDPRFAPRFGLPLTLILLAAGIILIWKMRYEAATSLRFRLTISLLLALTSITLLPGQAVHDHIVLLPGVFLIACDWRSMAASGRILRLLLALAAVAVFWQWVVAIPLLVIRYSLLPAKFFSNTILLLPFDAAPSVPLALTVVLGYLMAKALQRQSSV